MLTALVSAVLTLAACGAAQPSTLQDAPRDVPEAAEADSSFGKFSTVDFDGTEVTQEVFSQADLTLVNVWATWCGPCISELPGLEAISRSGKPGFQVVGIVYDLYDPATGETDRSAFETAEYIRAELALTYTNLIPDKSLYDGILNGIQAFPTTFFVDGAGNIVGEPVIGSQSEAAWEQEIDARLAGDTL